VNFVIPMAGRGQRFVDAGYTLPKMLIEAHGKTLLQWSVDSLPLDLCDSLIFIGLLEHEQRHAIAPLIRSWYGDRVHLEFIFIAEVTRGQAETVLLAEPFVSPSQPLVVFNIDTAFHSPSLRQRLLDRNTDGVLGSFAATDPRFSYATVDDSGYVSHVAEKVVISPHALTGMYCFQKAEEFFTVASRAITAGATIRGEFYIAPLYNDLIRVGRRFVLDQCESYAILGTPAELEDFLSKPPPEPRAS